MAVARPLYGVTIHNCIKRGDKTEMRNLLKEAKATAKAQGNLDKAIKDLEKASKKPGIDPRPLYGVPAHDAIKRGNKDEIGSLLTQARQTQKDQGDLKTAIKDLETALKAK